MWWWQCRWLQQIWNEKAPGGGCDDEHPAPPSPNILHRPQDPTGPNLFWRSNRSHSFFKIQQVPLFFEDPRSHPFSKSKVALFFEDPRSHSFSNPYFPIRLSLYWLLWDFHNVTLQYNKAMNICVHFCQTLVPLENLGKFVSNIVSSFCIAFPKSAEQCKLSVFNIQ